MRGSMVIRLRPDMSTRPPLLLAKRLFSCSLKIDALCTQKSHLGGIGQLLLPHESLGDLVDQPRLPLGRARPAHVLPDDVLDRRANLGVVMTRRREAKSEKYQVKQGERALDPRGAGGCILCSMCSSMRFIWYIRALCAVRPQCIVHYPQYVRARRTYSMRTMCIMWCTCSIVPGK